MGTKIKTKNNEYDISQEVPVGGRTWIDKLYIVSTVPQRLVGIIDDPEPEEAIRARSITMYGTLMYICDLAFQPMIRTDETGNPVNKEGRRLTGNERPEVIGVQGGTRVQLLTKYDIVFTPPILITEAQYMIRVADMEPDQGKWFIDEFLRIYDPPRIVR